MSETKLGVSVFGLLNGNAEGTVAVGALVVIVLIIAVVITVRSVARR
jgi:hypothetical protein